MTATDILGWLGETSLAISVLIVFILIIRKPFARLLGARAAYALWLAPAVRLFLPEFAVLPQPDAALMTDFVLMGDLAASISADSGVTFYDAGALAAAAALLVWITIAVAWFSIKMDAQARFMLSMLAKSKPAPNAIMTEARAIAGAFNVKPNVEIRICDEDHGPSIVGLFRPVIFLPADFQTAYSANERRLALAHEIAHIARGDMAAALAALAFQAVQWPNPLIHFSYRAFRIDQEAACDAAVLAKHASGGGAPGDYASAILKSARGGAHSPAYGLSLGHPVKERLMLLKNPKLSRLRKFAGGVAVAALAISGLAATANYGYAADGAADDKNSDIKTVVKKTKDDKKEKRVMIIRSGDDFEFEELVMDDVEFEIFHDGDGEKHVRMFHSDEEGNEHHGMMMHSDCTASEGEGEPVKLEWKDEHGDDNHVMHSVICITGDEAADPKKRAKALRKAIDQMEERAKKEEARRKRMIDGLRKQLRELEKKK